MSELVKGRRFQLWEFHVSHGSLLIRSPAAQESMTSIDIICVGVEYISAPRHLREVTIVQPTAEEIQSLEKVLQKSLPPSHVWIMQSAGQRFTIVASALQVREHSGEIFDSPFAG